MGRAIAPLTVREHALHVSIHVHRQGLEGIEVQRRQLPWERGSGRQLLAVEATASSGGGAGLRRGDVCGRDYDEALWFTMRWTCLDTREDLISFAAIGSGQRSGLCCLVDKNEFRVGCHFCSLCADLEAMLACDLDVRSGWVL
jgi:hypothetical protein